MQTITVNDAVGQALAEEMRRDPRVLTFGEGVATNRRDLLAEFGPQRVRNTPLAEGIIAGAAAGAAAMGLRPVIDLLFAPFLTLSMDAIMNSAGKLRATCWAGSSSSRWSCSRAPARAGPWAASTTTTWRRCSCTRPA